MDISTLTLFGGRLHADFFVVHFELVLRGVGGGAVPIGHLLFPELADLGADVTVLLAPFPLPLAELLDLAIFSDLSTDSEFFLQNEILAIHPCTDAELFF